MGSRASALGAFGSFGPNDNLLYTAGGPCLDINGLAYPVAARQMRLRVAQAGG